MAANDSEKARCAVRRSERNAASGSRASAARRRVRSSRQAVRNADPPRRASTFSTAEYLHPRAQFSRCSAPLNPHCLTPPTNSILP